MLNTCDTIVDFMKTDKSTISQWTNETGVLDLYIFYSQDIEFNARKLVEFSGKPPLPLETSLAYNQCRWNYFTQDEVEDLNQKLKEHGIPCDFIWLDIEHTDSKRYFTFDKEAFPDPHGLLQTLLDTDRQMITQVNPHYIHQKKETADEKRKSEAMKVLDLKIDNLGKFPFN